MGPVRPLASFATALYGCQKSALLHGGAFLCPAIRVFRKKSNTFSGWLYIFFRNLHIVLSVGNPSVIGQPMQHGTLAGEDNMRTGTITHYANDMEMGIIRDQNGEDFVFEIPDWCGPEREPKAGDDVSFDLQGLAAVNVAIIAQENRA